MTKRYLICIIGLLYLSPAVLFAQATVTAELSSTQIMIGDQVNLQIRIGAPEQIELNVDLAPLQEVENLELIGQSEPVVQETQQGIYLTQNITLTSFEAGEYSVPALPLNIRYASGRRENLQTGAIPLVVMTIPVNSDSLQLAPIKDIYREEFTVWDALPFFLTAAGVVLLGFAIWWFFIRKPEEELVIPTVYRSAHEIALEKLGLLEKKQLWQKQDIKAYYSEMTFIAREYLERRYAIRALESTTNEILTGIQEKEGINSELQQQLHRILNASDMVKFAKAEPAASFHTEALRTTRNFIESTQDEAGEMIPLFTPEQQRQLERGATVATVLTPQASMATPESDITLDTEPAPFWPRFFARAIDLLIILIVGFLTVSFTLYILGNVLEFSFDLLWSTLTAALFTLLNLWAYFALVPYRLGATPGKLLLGLREVDMDGGSLSLSKSSLRFGGKLLAELLLGIGYLTYFLNHKRQTLPDLIAKTKVVSVVHYPAFTIFAPTGTSLADFWPRFFARILDVVFLGLSIFLFLLVEVFILEALDARDGSSWMAVLVVLLMLTMVWAYFAYTTARFGGTPGKLLLKIRVVDHTGHSLNLKTASLRFLGWFLAESILGFGYLTYFLDKRKRQSLPDLFADTVVINKPKTNNQILLDHFED